VSAKSVVNIKPWISKHPPQFDRPYEESSMSYPQGPRPDQGEYRCAPRWTVIDRPEPKRTDAVPFGIGSRSDLQEPQMRCDEIGHDRFNASRPLLSPERVSRGVLPDNQLHSDLARCRIDDCTSIPLPKAVSRQQSSARGISGWVAFVQRGPTDVKGRLVYCARDVRNQRCRQWPSLCSMLATFADRLAQMCTVMVDSRATRTYTAQREVCQMQ
jgi:hypothetical protein